MSPITVGHVRADVCGRGDRVRSPPLLRYQVHGRPPGAPFLNMERWVTRMVPGGRFMVIRCDFGSDLVRQGHGNDMIVEALSRWCASRPGFHVKFRVVPVSPHSPSQNKVENFWGLVHGHAFSNACRSLTGGDGWSLMYVGSGFQHNHVPGRGSMTPQCKRPRAVSPSRAAPATCPPWSGTWARAAGPTTAAARPMPFGRAHAPVCASAPRRNAAGSCSSISVHPLSRWFRRSPSPPRPTWCWVYWRIPACMSPTVPSLRPRGTYTRLGYAAFSPPKATWTPPSSSPTPYRPPAVGRPHGPDGGR
jgi:hypothetical protein